ncbi:hypothetical protein DMENIID0001_096030 [Sergentomyia squamirostris]
MDIMNADIALKRAVLEDEQQYTQLCRICLITSERNFKNMTRSVYGTIPYFDVYSETVGRKMVPFGKFSPRICSMCEIEMIEAYKFRQKCLQADEKVTKLLEQLAPPPEPLDITGDEAVASSSRLQIKKETEEQEILDERTGMPTKTTVKAEKKEGGKKRKKFRCKVCRVIFADMEIFKVHKCMCCEPKIIKDTRAVQGSKMAKERQKRQKEDVNMKGATIRRNRNRDDYTCDQCGKVCTNRQGYLLHMDEHNKTLRYDCDQCDEKFRSWDARRTHIYRVHLKKPFCTCPHCGKGFFKINYMQTHIQEYHSADFPGYQCDKCGKNIRSKAVFAVHYKSHVMANEKSTDKKVTCKICNKKLMTMKTLTKHMETHTGERNYICPVCGKTYTCNFTMKNHVKRTHPDQTHLLPPDGTIVNQKCLKKRGISVNPALQQNNFPNLSPNSSQDMMVEGALM